MNLFIDYHNTYFMGRNINLQKEVKMIRQKGQKIGVFQKAVGFVDKFSFN